MRFYLYVFSSPETTRSVCSSLFWSAVQMNVPVSSSFTLTISRSVFLTFVLWIISVNPKTEHTLSGINDISTVVECCLKSVCTFAREAGHWNTVYQVISLMPLQGFEGLDPTLQGDLLPGTYEDHFARSRKRSKRWREKITFMKHFSLYSKDISKEKQEILCMQTKTKLCYCNIFDYYWIGYIYICPIYVNNYIWVKKAVNQVKSGSIIQLQLFPQVD